MEKGDDELHGCHAVFIVHAVEDWTVLLSYSNGDLTVLLASKQRNKEEWSLLMKIPMETW